MWPYHKINTEKLRTPLNFARFLFYAAICIQIPTVVMFLSDSNSAQMHRISYLLVSIPISLLLTIISVLIAALISFVESKYRQ